MAVGVTAAVPLWLCRAPSPPLPLPPFDSRMHSDGARHKLNMRWRERYLRGLGMRMTQNRRQKRTLVLLQLLQNAAQTSESSPQVC